MKGLTMQNAELMTDNSESQDGEAVRHLTSKSYSTEEAKPVTNAVSSCSASASASNQSNANISAGYYDAEKCRAHIANQSRVSKIDRFSAQANRALEVESNVHHRLSNVLNMYVQRSAQVVHDFSLKCKLGSQRHRQDRILNQTKRGARRNLSSQSQQQKNHRQNEMSPINISNDLLYGQGAQLVHELLNQPMLSLPPRHLKRKKVKHEPDTSKKDLSDPSQNPPRGPEFFEPSLFVDQLGESIRENMRKSRAITNKLITLQQLFKNMATEHRDKVDFVYAAEEERQATTVIRRSAYNLSVAAIKATSTPMST